MKAEDNYNDTGNAKNSDIINGNNTSNDIRTDITNK